jgi:hypothetical protein
MSIHSEQAFIDWVIDVLEDGGLTVGDGIAPKNVPARAGYVVVYSIAAGTTSGSLQAPRSDAEPGFQVTSVSKDPAQTRWLVDRVRSLLDAAVPATLSDDRRVIWLDFPMGSVTAIRDDDVQPPKWYAPDRFSAGTS